MALFEEKEKRLLEALLFVAYEPLPVAKLSEIMGISPSLVKEILLDLAEEYANKGFSLQEIGGGWQFLTQEEFAIYIEKLYKPKTQQLSKAALETLAIIAYRQPITRLEIESIRQVKVDAVVNKLMDKNLIREVGRRDGPGRSILYGTTKDFLNFFGINSIEELPPLANFSESATEINLEPELFVYENSVKNKAKA